MYEKYIYVSKDIFIETYIYIRDILKEIKLPCGLRLRGDLGFALQGTWGGNALVCFGIALALADNGIALHCM